MSELPIPFSSYLDLIRKRRSPYYDLLQYIISDMERYYVELEYPSETIYTINPKMLHKEISEKIHDEKLTTLNIVRIIIAALHGSDLQEDEDYYVTTTSGGRKRYHIRLNSDLLLALRTSF